MRFVGRATAASGLLLWLLTTAVTWQVAKSALRPVKDIVEKAERIDPRKLDQRLPARSADDELSRISRTVNRMLDRIQQGCQRERQFTGDASHEIRIPLAKMIAEIDLALSRKRGQAEYEDALVRMRRYAEGMQRLSESLLMLARLDGGLESIEIRPFDVASLAMDVLKSLPQDSTERIHLELGESARPMRAMGHRELIGVLLGNLIDNALRYSLPQSPVYLRISNHSENIRIEVEDEGQGIPEEQIERVFDRFYCRERARSKQSGGIGLGLSIVKAIADVHGTTVTLTRGAKHGTLAIFALSSFSHAYDSESQHM
jgi:signal transduction histidine kinase